MISSHQSSNPLVLVALFLTLFCSVYNAAELTLRDTTYDTDIATAGVGDGLFTQYGSTYTATLSFAGVTGTVNEAYLYWYKLVGSTTVATDTITLNCNTITGNDIGIAGTNCFGGGYSQVFRADITSLVTGAAASYMITGIPPSSNSYRHTTYNGFSLIVFFDDGDDSNNRDVVLYDGNDSNRVSSFDPAGWNIILNDINFPASGTAGLELHISDGQNARDGNIIINGNSQPLVADGNQGQYFDIVNFDITAFMTPNTVNTITITHTIQNDCLSAIVALVTLPVGAAPRECYDTNENNPCTDENIAVNHLYHPSCTSCCHFIQCNTWGTAYDMPCSTGNYWDPIAYTCNHNVGQCADDGCSLSPIAGAAVQAHINSKYKSYDIEEFGDGNGKMSNGIIQQIGNKNYTNYYGYILLIAVIAFILINNIFIGCFCLGKGRNKQYAKCDLVDVNDMDEI